MVTIDREVLERVLDVLKEMPDLSIEHQWWCATTHSNSNPCNCNYPGLEVKRQEVIAAIEGTLRVDKNVDEIDPEVKKRLDQITHE